MIAEFVDKHLLWTLPESYEDLADRDDSTVGGRRVLWGLIFAHAAIVAYVAGAIFL
jgi:hypothetical protein